MDMPKKWKEEELFQLVNKGTACLYIFHQGVSVTATRPSGGWQPGYHQAVDDAVECGREPVAARYRSGNLADDAAG